MTTEDSPSAREEQQEAPDIPRDTRHGVFAYLERSRAADSPGTDFVAAEAGEVAVARQPEPAVQLPRTAVPGSASALELRLKILVLEDYPEVMDTIVANITRYLHTRRQQAAPQDMAEQHYSVQGIVDIEVLKASRPEEALAHFGHYSEESRELASLHERDEAEIVYGVFDVVLGHNLSGIDVLEIIKRQVPDFRAIVLTAQTNTEEEIGRTVELADAYRKKQVSMDPEHRYLLAQDIAEKVNDIVEERRAQYEALRSKSLLSTMPELLAIVLDYYDFITGTHCRGVTDLALYIGQQLKTSLRYIGRPEYDDRQLDLEMLGFNAVLHDIGKIMAPKRILGKTGFFSKEESDLVAVVCQEIARAAEDWEDVPPDVRQGLRQRLDSFRITEDRQQEIKLLGRLAPNEMEVMRFHVAASELIRDDLRPYVERQLADPELVAYIMRLFDGLYHHEKPDGSGYPYGCSGEEYEALPTASKVILVADTYHALRSRRSYKPGMTHTVAVSLLRDLAGNDRVVSDCVDIISGLPQEVVDSVDALNEQRIGRLIRRAFERVYSLGVRNPAQLFADLMSSNSINPEGYLNSSKALKTED